MRIFCLFFILITLTNQIDWSSVQKIINDGLNQGKFTGFAISVINKTNTIYQKVGGYRQFSRGIFAPKVTSDTMFDLNSLTQVVGINSIIMRYYDRMRLNYTGLVRLHYSEFGNHGKQYTTIQQLMLHNSGLQANLPDPLPNDPTKLISQINNLSLQYKSDTKFQYSQLGYIVLGQMVRKMANRTTLNQALFQLYVQLDLKDTIYNPDKTKYQFAPSGLLNGATNGRTFNKYSNILNGDSGNSGMFSNIKDITSFMNVMLNNGRKPSGYQVFTQKVVGQFTSRFAFTKYKNTRALGWDTIPATNPPCGTKFSANSYGLSDISGSYIWADKTKGIAIIFLANGNFPFPKPQVDKWQGTLSNAIMTALGY